MSTGVMHYERPATWRRRAPRGLPGAAVRAGRLLELWGYRAARSAEQGRRTVAVRGPEAVARGGAASSEMLTRPRIY